MSRLTRYLLRLFTQETATIFAIAMLLIWLLQLLREFDLVAVRGQDLPTLGGQALLALPQIAMAILFVAMGIGMARALMRLQASRELHIIHSSGRMSSLFKAAAIFALTGTVLMLVVANWVEPAASRQLRDWNAQVAADLVSRAVVPGRFIEVAPEVVMNVLGRSENGLLESFFADDRRDPEVRRTYSADSAVLARDEQGYILRLEDGRMQFAEAEGGFSEIAFDRYDLVLDTLTGRADDAAPEATLTSLEIITQSIVSGQWTQQSFARLLSRLAEGVRVIGLCLLVTAIAAFPSARRGVRRVPLEIVVIVIAVGERLIWEYVPGRNEEFVQAGTAAVLLVCGIVLLMARLRPDIVLLRERPA